MLLLLLAQAMRQSLHRHLHLGQRLGRGGVAGQGAGPEQLFFLLLLHDLRVLARNEQEPRHDQHPGGDACRLPLVASGPVSDAT